MRKKTKELIESELYKSIYNDLIHQLGDAGSHYVNLVGDYMDMWVTKCQLVEDIQKRGVVIKYDNGGGQKGKKRNESIEQRIKINAQMLKLLAELGMKPSPPDGDGDDL